MNAVSGMKRLRSRLKTSALFTPSHARVLRANTKLLEPWLERLKRERRLDPLALKEQPFDRVFLALSPLYRHSREAFLSGGGIFEPKLTTSPRSLSSLILTENRIEYTPHESELLWTLRQKAGKKHDTALRQLVTFSTSLFHEQNHRLLWRMIAPPRPLTRDSLRRYLNFMESLVITLDMALGDELTPELASFGYLSGTLYDPGTAVAFGDSRARRNYLHAALSVTYLALEGYAKEDLRRVRLASADSAGLPREAIRHSVDRALRLDDEFIEKTNPLWQRKWEKTLLNAWSSRKTPMSPNRFEPSAEPLHWTAEYLLAEKVFDVWGL